MVITGCSWTTPRPCSRRAVSSCWLTTPCPPRCVSEVTLLEDLCSLTHIVEYMYLIISLYECHDVACHVFTCSTSRAPWRRLSRYVSLLYRVCACVCVRATFFFFLCLRVLFLFFLYFDTGKILVNIYMLSFSTSHFALHSFFFSNICLPTGPHTYTHCPTLLGSFSDKTFSHLNLRLVSSAAILYTALGLLGLAAFFSFSIKLYR